MLSHFTRDDFGGSALELAGRAVHPDMQGRGIGSGMLDRFLNTHPVEYLTTYTRNPAVLRMIGNVATSLYPLVDDPELYTIATQMSNAIPVEDATYHIDRYPPGGLFRGDDPADLAIATTPQPLKQRFALLESERNALVITAKINGEKQ